MADSSSIRDDEKVCAYIVDVEDSMTHVKYVVTLAPVNNTTHITIVPLLREVPFVFMCTERNSFHYDSFGDLHDAIMRHSSLRGLETSIPGAGTTVAAIYEIMRSYGERQIIPTELDVKETRLMLIRNADDNGSSNDNESIDFFYVFVWFRPCA